MPKIPLSNKTFLDTRHDVVHAPNAPGMDFGMDTARNLGRAADLAGRVGDNIWGAVRSAVGARADFLKQMEHQEDVLAATEDRNLFNRLNGELNNQLANTPGATDEEKQSWIDGYRQKYEDERKPFLDRMSGTFRKQHDAEMNGLFIRANDDRMRVLIQGRVQRVTDLTLSQLKDAALRGDEAEYRRILDNAQNGGVPLFSAEKRAELEQNYYHLADFGKAKRAVEANTPDIDAKLAERGKDGKYKNYPHLHETEREQLRRAAVTMRTRAEAQENAQFTADLYSGKLNITPEELKEKYQRGGMSPAQYNVQDKVLNGFIRKRQRDEARAAKAEKAALAEQKKTGYEERRREEVRNGTERIEEDVRRDFLDGKINYPQYRKELGEIRRGERSRAADDAKAQRDRKKAFLFKVHTTFVPTDVDEARELFVKMSDEAAEKFKGDPEALDNVMKVIENTFSGDRAVDKDFALPGGQEILQFIKDNYGESADAAKNLEHFNGFPYGWTDSEEYMAARYNEIMDIARQMLRRPNVKVSDIQKEIEYRVKLLNDGFIKNLIKDLTR